MLLKLSKVIDELSDVKSFFWEADEKFDFVAGQYFYYTLPKLNYDDIRGATRHFTLSNSPTENEFLRLTTKFPSPMSGFKKTLLELKVGDEIEGRGPQGTFQLDTKTARQQVMIAGGIGITPFRSMIKYSFDKKLDLPYLIYSNSDENFAFGDELKEMLGDKLILYDSSTSGHIDSMKIVKFIENWKLKIENCDWYIVGPPKFVDAIEMALEQLGVVGGKIQSEKFTGY